MNPSQSAAIAFIREKKTRSKLTQSEISRRSSGLLPQRTISRIEIDPFSTSAETLRLYLQIIGTNLSEMESYMKASNVRPENSLSTHRSERIEAAIEGAISKLNKAKEVLYSNENASEILENRGAFAAIDDSVAMIRAIGKKPIIGFYGLFDSAKSAVINSLLGEDWMPEGYQPETSIVNIIAHVSDRPDWLTGDVAVFKHGFNPNLLTDQNHAKSLMVEQGSKDILRRLGRHQYLEGSTDHKEAAISMVFVESEAVKGVWLMDTPGDLNGIDDQTDRQRAEGSLHFCDGVVFMSPVTGFLSGPSLAYFNTILRSIPPIVQDGGKALDHVRIVMSHAHKGVSDRQVTEIKQKLGNNFSKLSDGIFSYWNDTEGVPLATSEEFLNCITAFYREDEDRHAATTKSIYSLASYCQKMQEERVLQKIAHHTLKAVHQLLGIKTSVISDMRSCEERVEEAESNYLRFRNDNLPILEEEAKEIIEFIRNLSSDAQDDVSGWVKSTISKDALEDYIDENFGDKKEAQSDAPAMIMSRIDQFVSKRMRRDSKMYSKELDGFLSKWEGMVNTPEIGGRLSSDTLPSLSGGFDARASMLAGIVGIGSYGAMAAYVATLGNLGGYIIGAKLAGLLVSAGLITDVTVVTSAIAAIGGPVTIMLALSLAIAGFIYKIFGDRWQKTLAKDINEKLEDEDIVEEITESIADYWRDTETAFKKGVEALKTDSESYYRELKKRAMEEFDTRNLQAANTSIDKSVLEIN